MPQPGVQMINVPSQLLVEELNNISECQGSKHAGIRHLLEKEFMNNPQCRQNQGLTCKIVSQMAVYSISRLSRQLNSPIMSPQVQYSVNRVWDPLLILWSLSIPKVGGELCSCKGRSQVRNPWPDHRGSHFLAFIMMEGKGALHESFQVWIGLHKNHGFFHISTLWGMDCFQSLALQLSPYEPSLCKILHEVVIAICN